ncbi:hypothetical protein ScPMuIL_016854 [Solemya velum]
MPGECELVTCPEHHMCVALANGHHVCHRSECRAPEVQNATIQSSMRYIGCHVTYECIDGSFPIGCTGSSEIKCLENGDWTTPTCRCIASTDEAYGSLNRVTFFIGGNESVSDDGGISSGGSGGVGVSGVCGGVSDDGISGGSSGGDVSGGVSGVSGDVSGGGSSVSDDGGVCGVSGGGGDVNDVSGFSDVSGGVSDVSGGVSGGVIVSGGVSGGVIVSGGVSGGVIVSGGDGCASNVSGGGWGGGDINVVLVVVTDLPYTSVAILTMVVEIWMDWERFCRLILHSFASTTVITTVNVHRNTCNNPHVSKSVDMTMYVHRNKFKNPHVNMSVVITTVYVHRNKVKNTHVNMSVVITTVYVQVAGSVGIHQLTVFCTPLCNFRLGVFAETVTVHMGPPPSRSVARSARGTPACGVEEGGETIYT